VENFVARLFEPATADFDGAARVVDAWAIVAFDAQVARVGLCGGAGWFHDFFVATAAVCFSFLCFPSVGS
jgi:hypothetical protein